MISKYGATSVVVCWDGGIPNFRRADVPEYKANRSHGEDDPDGYADFLRQMQELQDYTFPMMGIVSVRREGCEADDLVYHACSMLTGAKLVVSSDKDLLQTLAFPNVRVLKGEKIYTKEVLEEEIGIPFRWFVDWRAIQGDSSDNIPGVRGIGEKTATKLMNEIGDVIMIYNAAMGKSQKKDMLSQKMKDAIVAFGQTRLIRNIHAMALYQDRVGARFALNDAITLRTPANGNRINKYLMQNAFSSLIGDMLASNMCSLTTPEMQEVKIPLSCGRRFPL